MINNYDDWGSITEIGVVSIKQFIAQRHDGIYFLSELCKYTCAKICKLAWWWSIRIRMKTI